MRTVKYESIPKTPKDDGSLIGSLALLMAVKEYMVGAREVGGNNRGPYVKMYMNGLAEEGSSWCSAFVSYCVHRSMGKYQVKPPFPYHVSAKAFFNDCRTLGYELKDEEPEQGDIVFWYRGDPKGWQGHVGFVVAQDGKSLWTLEGNRNSKVDCFQYSIVDDPEMDKIIGYVRIPDSLLNKQVDNKPIA